MDVRKWVDQKIHEAHKECTHRHIPDGAGCTGCIANTFTQAITKLVEALKELMDCGHPRACWVAAAFFAGIDREAHCTACERTRLEVAAFAVGHGIPGDAPDADLLALDKHDAEVRDRALEEAAIIAKCCESWYEGHGDEAASHAADEIRALKGST